MLRLPGAHVALVLLSLTVAACADDEDAPFDHVADCQDRMVRGSPNEDLGNFTSGVKSSVEHIEVFVSAEYSGSDGKRHKDYFHCSYVNEVLTASDRRPAAPGEAKSPQQSEKSSSGWFSF